MVSVNVSHGGEFMDPLLEFLKKEWPDILCIQEAFNEHSEDLPPQFRTIDILSQELSFDHHYFAACYKNDFKGYVGEKGNAIFSRFPIIETKNTFYDLPYTLVVEKGFNFEKTPRALQKAVIKLPQGNLNVFNTQGIWRLDGVDTERRLNMSRIIIDQVRDLPNVILTGDFNADWRMKTITDIEKYLINIFKGELKTSFNMKHKTDPGYARAVVDMIFVSPDIKVLEHYSPNVDVSDHFPLVATLDLPAGRQEV